MHLSVPRGSGSVRVSRAGSATFEVGDSDLCFGIAVSRSSPLQRIGALRSADHRRSRRWLVAHGDAQLWESLGERRKLVERARRCVGVEDARSGADAMGELGMVCGGVASDKNRTAARMHEVGDVARRVARRGDGPERPIPEHVHDMIEGQHGFGVPEVDPVLRTAGEVIAGWALASAEYHWNGAVEIGEPRSVRKTLWGATPRECSCEAASSPGLCRVSTPIVDSSPLSGAL
jgi:hypothetical protein